MIILVFNFVIYCTFSPFQVQEFEPLEDYVRELFQNYRLIKTKVLTHLQSKSLERAELANKFRQSKTFYKVDSNFPGLRLS